MTMLILGVALWWAVHLFPAAAPKARANLLERFGGAYRGIFALLIVGSLALIVFGWRSTTPTFVYAEPEWGRVVNMAFMLIAFILFFSSATKNNIHRLLRHPQLTGVLLWSVGHLLANGDSRSVFLFAAMGLWALVEIVLINRRDGAWERPAARPFGREIVPLAIGAIVYGVVGWAHPYIAGVAIY